MNQEDIKKIVDALREEQAKVQDDARQSASETYSKLHQSMQLEIRDRFQHIENIITIQKNNFEHFVERFGEHMVIEERQRQELIDLVKTNRQEMHELISLKSDKDQSWAESALLRIMWTVIGAVLVAVLGLVIYVRS